MNAFLRGSVLTFVHISFRTFPSMSRLSLFFPLSALFATLFACVPLSQAADAKAPDKGAPSTNKAPEVSVFLDKRLEDAVRQQVFAKRYTNSPLTAADVANVSTFNGNGKGITNLAGLEHCKALAAVDLAGNAIADLSPLKGLKQLQYLNLATNKLKTIAPLATLPALQYIEISQNQVADLAPIGGLTNLASLYAGHNRIKSAGSLTNLPRIVSVHLEFNQIGSIAGFQNLRGVGSLSLSHNQVTDVSPLTGLRAPTYLFLDDNRIRDLAPLNSWITNDLVGAKNFAPFVNLYLHGNRFNAKTRQLLTEWKKGGVRVNE